MNDSRSSRSIPPITRIPLPLPCSPRMTIHHMMIQFLICRMIISTFEPSIAVRTLNAFFLIGFVVTSRHCCVDISLWRERREWRVLRSSIQVSTLSQGIRTWNDKFLWLCALIYCFLHLFRYCVYHFHLVFHDLFW